TGGRALYTNTTGNNNTATGYSALRYNTTGTSLAAFGSSALSHNTTGVSNAAVGYGALNNNTNGVQNTAAGAEAMYGGAYNNGTGSYNTATGFLSLYNLTSGRGHLGGGSNNIYIGASVLGNSADANATRIGATTQTKTFIGGISGKTVSNSTAVYINASGQLGTVQSSARYKDDIKPMGKASEAILALNPVTFRYKEELDPEHIPQFGLIAEEVEKVNPDLVVRDEEGKVMTVRYEAVNAMLVNEFLKEHTTVQQQKAEIAGLKSLTGTQQKQIEALTAAVQKVSEK